MICEICKDKEIKCLSCYDIECGITGLRKKITLNEEKLAHQKDQLRIMIKYEAENRIKSLNEYLSQ